MPKIIIPDEIVQYAKNQINGCGYDFIAEDLQKARERAILAIAQYKEVRKVIIERKARKEEISAWLKSIGHEAGK